MCKYFVNTKFFCQCEIFVVVNISPTRIFCQSQYFLSTRTFLSAPIFCCHQYFVGVNILLVPIFLSVFRIKDDYLLLMIVFCVYHCGAGGSSFANLQQRVAKTGSRPLLDENWRTQGTQKKVKNNRNWAELLLHDVYFIRSQDPQIHNNHGCNSTINWFRRTCNESK
jgi:hypothetical protein